MADDYDKLLADVEASLGGSGGSAGRGGSAPARRRKGTAAKDEAAAPARRPGRVSATAKSSVVAGGLGAAGIFALFALLPFLRAGSGAAGAFLAVTIAVFVMGLRHRS